MSARGTTTSTALAIGLLLLLGCGGGGGGGDDGGCGSEWNTQVVLTFDGPAGCPGTGYQEVLCARFLGATEENFVIEIDVRSSSCAEDTILLFAGTSSSGGSLFGDDFIESRDCLVDALAPGQTSILFEALGGARLADSFTYGGTWTASPALCTGTFTIEGALP